MTSASTLRPLTSTSTLLPISTLPASTNAIAIGYPRYGTNFEQFLWQLTPSPNELRNYILERIGDTFYLSQLNTEVNVEVLNGEIRNIYYVKIAVTYNEETKYREYQFR